MAFEQSSNEHAAYSFHGESQTEKWVQQCEFWLYFLYVSHHLLFNCFFLFYFLSIYTYLFGMSFSWALVFILISGLQLALLILSSTSTTCWLYLFPSFIEMYLRPPSAREEARINDWIKVRQSGIRYYLSLGDQRIVDKNYIIRPKAEFEVCHIMEYLQNSLLLIYSHSAPTRV